MLTNIDEHLFNFFFNLAAGSPLIGNIMAIITIWSSRVFAVIYLFAVVLMLAKNNKKVLPIIAAPAVTVFAVQIIRFFYLRPRPFVALEIDNLIYHTASGSMPSMHAASAFVIAAVIWCVHKKAGNILLLFAFVTGLSRVMVGVHFPADVLLGSILGLSFGFTAFKIVDKLGWYKKYSWEYHSGE